jgi:anti-sigma regulatory factor (Ser/Thr protein kinase)
MCTRHCPRPLYIWTRTTDQPVAAVRTHLQSALRATGLDAERLDDPLITASELATNAHRYAPGPYELILRTTPTEVVIEIHDRGHQLPPSAPVCPVEEIFAPRASDRCGGTDALLARLSESGRGLAIVRALSSGRCGFRLCSDGKAAWCAIAKP